MDNKGDQVQFGRVGVDAVRIGKGLIRVDDPTAKLGGLTADEDSRREHFF